jgi:hypothetical protein
MVVGACQRQPAACGLQRVGPLRRHRPSRAPSQSSFCFVEASSTHGTGPRASAPLSTDVSRLRLLGGDGGQRQPRVLREAGRCIRVAIDLVAATLAATGPRPHRDDAADDAARVTPPRAGVVASGKRQGASPPRHLVGEQAREHSPRAIGERACEAGTPAFRHSIRSWAGVGTSVKVKAVRRRALFPSASPLARRPKPAGKGPDRTAPVRFCCMAVGPGRLLIRAASSAPHEHPSRLPGGLGVGWAGSLSITPPNGKGVDAKAPTLLKLPLISSCYGGPRGTRTPALWFRKPPLYPPELWGQNRRGTPRTAGGS